MPISGKPMEMVDLEMSIETLTCQCDGICLISELLSFPGEMFAFY